MTGVDVEAAGVDVLGRAEQDLVQLRGRQAGIGPHHQRIDPSGHRRGKRGARGLPVAPRHRRHPDSLARGRHVDVIAPARPARARVRTVGRRHRRDRTAGHQGQLPAGVAPSGHHHPALAAHVVRRVDHDRVPGNVAKTQVGHLRPVVRRPANPTCHRAAVAVAGRVGHPNRHDLRAETHPHHAQRVVAGGRRRARHLRAVSVHVAGVAVVVIEVPAGHHLPRQIRVRGVHPRVQDRDRRPRAACVIPRRGHSHLGQMPRAAEVGVIDRHLRLVGVVQFHRLEIRVVA